MSRAARIAFCAFLLAACALPLICPGDVPFVSDEPHLIAAALRANREGRLAPVGLYGSFGVPYGPLPTQLYQLLLLVSHDPVILVLLRAFACTATTAGALLWLARTLRLTPWFVPAVLLSPFLWHFNRLLWDNTFAIPVGALLVAAYADFLKTAAGRSLVAAFACTLALVSIHLMTAPLVAAFGGHMLWRHRAAMWKHRLGIACVLLIGAISTYGFAARTVRRAVVRMEERRAVSASGRPATPAVNGTAPAPAAAAPSPIASDRLSRAAAFAFPIFGGRIVTGGGFYIAWERFGPAADAAIRVARAVSLVGYALVWGGIALAARLVYQQRRSPDRANAQATLLAILLAALVLQMAQDALMRVAPYPHYYTGTAVLFILFAWLAIDRLPAARWLRATAIGVYAASLAVLTLASLWRIHHDGGTRRGYGPTLANQWTVAQGARQYAADAALTDVPHVRKYPHAGWALRMLLLPMDVPRAAVPPGKRLAICPTSGNPSDGRIELRLLAEPLPPPFAPVPLEGEAGWDPFAPDP